MYLFVFMWVYLNLFKFILSLSKFISIYLNFPEFIWFYLNLFEYIMYLALFISVDQYLSCIYQYLSELIWIDLVFIWIYLSLSDFISIVLYLTVFIWVDLSWSDFI